MKIKEQEVQVIDTAEQDFGTSTEVAHVINDLYTLTNYNDSEWFFRSITGESADSQPVVDLDKCRRFEIIADFPEGVNIEWLLNATLFDIMQRYAK